MGLHHIIFPLALWAIGTAVFAQAPSPVATPANAQEKPETQEKKPQSKGDTVHFKNGRLLAGVQVIGESAESFEVVPAPGVKALTLPRSMIESIDYDAINDAKGNWLLDSAGTDREKLLEGKEISPELYSKITKPLFKEKRAYAETDFKMVLEELAHQCEVEIVFGESVLALSKEERVWSVELQTNTSFLNLLQTEFSKNFPEVEWAYQFDKIAVNMQNDTQVK